MDGLVSFAFPGVMRLGAVGGVDDGAGLVAAAAGFAAAALGFSVIFIGAAVAPLFSRAASGEIAVGELLVPV